MKYLNRVLALVMAVAVTAAFVTTRSVQRMGPFYTSTVNWDSTTGSQVGGEVRIFLAADSLKIGDVVYVSAANKVAKSTTLANYNTLAGVVVGGARHTMFASVASADVGTLTATANQRVLVLKQGRAWVANDGSTTLTYGASIIPSDSVAGKVEVRGAALDSMHRVIGRVPIGGAGTVLADVNVK